MSSFELKPNAVLRNYLLSHRLGDGATGEVWLARDRLLNRDVALKMLRANSQGDASESAMRDLLREAQAAAQLNHPNTVTVYEINRTGGHVYIAMEYVQRGSLADEVDKGGPLPWRDALKAVRDAASGLQAAHELGIFHRDIKPSNLMRSSRGLVKVVDFGLAKSGGAGKSAVEATQTMPGTIHGSPAFMSPEQCRGEPVDARSDLYSLMCTLYYLLTGTVPFKGDLPTVLYKHCNEAFPVPRVAGQILPDSVRRILINGAQKKAIARYQSAEEVLADIDAALAEPDPPAPEAALMETMSAPIPISAVGAPTGGEAAHSRPASEGTDGTTANDALFELAATVRREPVPDLLQALPSDQGQIATSAKPRPRRLLPALAGVSIIGLILVISAIVHFAHRHPTVSGNNSSTPSPPTPLASDALGDADDPAARQRAQARLQADPGDSDANDLLGRWLCFTKEDWEHGLPMLAKTRNPILGEWARKELDKPAPGEAVDLAEQWWTYADRHAVVSAAIYKHAKELYRVAWPDLTGVALLNALNRLGDSVPSTDLSSTELHTSTDAAGHRVVDLMPMINPARDARMGTWARSKTELVVSSGLSADKASKIGIGYLPPDEYDFRVEFIRVAGIGDLQQMMSHDGISFNYGLDEEYGHVVRLGRVMGQDDDRPLFATTRPQPMQDGIKHVSITKVRNSSISATLDGEPVLAFPTNYGDVCNEGVWGIGGSILGVGARESDVVFTSITVTEISGQGMSMAGFAPNGLVDLIKNGDFKSGNKMPDDWFLAGVQGGHASIVRDTDAAHDGLPSLRLAFNDTRQCMAHQDFWLPFSGAIVVSGYYKITPEINDASAWFMLSSAPFGVLMDGGLPRTAEWRRFAFYVALPQRCGERMSALNLACNGTGTVWFNDVHVFHIPGTGKVAAQPTLLSSSDPDEHFVWVRRIAFRPNGQLSFIRTDGGSEVVCQMDVASGGGVKEIGGGGNHVDLTSMGRTFIGGSIHDDVTNRSFPVKEIANWKYPRISPDGKWLVAHVQANGNSIWRVFNAQTGERLLDLGESGDEETNEPYSADSRYFVTSRGEGDVQVYDTKSWTLKSTDNGSTHDRKHQRGYPFPDGQKVLLINKEDWNGSAIIWDWVNNTRKVHFAQQEHSWWQKGAVSPDGKWVITHNGVVDQLWNADTGALVHTLQDSPDVTYEVSSMAFSPDSKRMLLGYYTGKAFLFDVASGKRLAEFIGQPGPVEAITFSPDGRLAATAHREEGNIVRVWKMPP